MREQRGLMRQVKRAEVGKERTGKVYRERKKGKQKREESRSKAKMI